MKSTSPSLYWENKGVEPYEVKHFYITGQGTYHGMEKSP